MPEWRVAQEAAGERIDRFLGKVIAGLSVAAAKRMIAAGSVRLDGRPVRKGQKIVAGQVVSVDGEAAIATPELPVLPDPGLPLVVLHADDLMVAVAKPAGIPSHPLAPGERGTAANAICARFPECATASPDRREGGLVHRLDNATSGVLLAARSPEGWSRLRAALSEPASEKTYLAEVVGRPPLAGVETAPIGRTGRRGDRVRVGGGRRPQEARTAWELVEAREATALLRVRLGSGRAHQVRAHLAAAGFPIVGDDKYGVSSPGAGGLRLHAASVRLRHPGTGATILIEAPPPDWANIRGP
jgi:23S rRNA pseudouridine1911/1915/1917 synthase